MTPFDISVPFSLRSRRHRRHVTMLPRCLMPLIPVSRRAADI